MPAPVDVASLARRLAVPAAVATFDDDEIAGLPEPVRRYFRAAVTPGVALARSARITMRGRIKLGTRWVPFRARETLAPHEGFVWAGRAAGIVSGSDHYADGAGVLDWRLFGLLRVAHGEGADVARSAAGRCAGEGLWLPTALLPRFGVSWEAEDDHRLVASFEIHDFELRALITVDDRGAVQTVGYDRWGDPSGTGVFGWHPFGLVATRHASFAGVTVPSAGRVGWYPGTERWPDGEFFRYDIADLRPVAPG